MSAPTTEIIWSFPLGSPLYLLAGFLLVGLILAVSLKFRCRRLSKGKRFTLATLRLIMLAIIGLCFANPVKLIETPVAGAAVGKVAVIFDTSGSMRIPTTGGDSRLVESIKSFARLQRSTEAYADYDYFRLDETLSSVNQLDSLVALPEAPVDSKLNQQLLSLHNSLDFNRYKKVLVYTDGINTGSHWGLRTGNTSPRDMSILIADSELPMECNGEITRIEHPHYAYLNTETLIHLSYRVDHLPRKLPITVTLLDDAQNNLFEREMMPNSDRQQVFGHLNITQKIYQADWQHYRLRLSVDGKVLDESEIAILGRKRLPKKILIVQGYADLNLTPLRSVFNEKKYFDVSYRFIDDSWISYDEAPAEFYLRDYYDVVILMNLTTSGEINKVGRRLEDFIKSGGAVVCLMQDPITAASIQGCNYRHLFPLIPNANQPPNDVGNLIFDPSNGRIRVVATEHPRSPFTQFNRYYNAVAKGEAQESLHPFKLTAEGRASQLFRSAERNQDLVPQYAKIVTTLKLQNAAQVLADSHHKERFPVVASQFFGSGHVLQFATGALWEWKAVSNQEGSDFETFWRNVLSFVTSHQTDFCEWETVELDGPGQRLLQATFKQIEPFNTESGWKFFIESDGEKSRFVPALNANGHFSAKLPLGDYNMYRVVAEDANGNEVDAYHHFRPETRPLEYERLVADFENASAIAAVFENTEVVSMSDSTLLSGLETKIALPETKIEKVSVWQTWFMISLLLLLYGVDLFLRRNWKTI